MSWNEYGLLSSQSYCYRTVIVVNPEKEPDGPLSAFFSGQFSQRLCVLVQAHLAGPGAVENVERAVNEEFLERVKLVYIPRFKSGVPTE